LIKLIEKENEELEPKGKKRKVVADEESDRPSKKKGENWVASPSTE